MRKLWAFWAYLTSFFRVRQARIRRERYEELKALISARHFGGFAGLIVEDKKFDRLDIACFQPPMYQYVKNADMKWCIFWDRARMAREIGVGAPLKDGEVMLPDSTGRTKPSSSLETINEQQALTHQKEPAEDEPETV